MNKKIISIENLKRKILNFKKKNKKIVLCHGVFDLLHLGHINHFKEAKNKGDILIVSITTDKYVRKGPNRPAFKEQDRMNALSAISSIDFIVLNKDPTAVTLIKELKPNIYCKGKEYKLTKNDLSGEIKNEINALKKVKGKIFYTGGITFSSSNLLNRYGPVFTEYPKNTVDKIKREYSFLEAKNLVYKLKKLKILVIGELIIDRYVFCEALGKSGKEPVLVLRDKSSEEYLGGSAAIVRHISNFVDKITLFSMIGDKNEYLGKIKKLIPKNVKINLLKKKNSPTILKTRFVDSINFNKVLGVYKINDKLLDKKQEKKQINFLKKNLSKFDMVIVSDYGHGFITKSISKLICRKSKFLALNAQVNAANIGYHSMRNYKNLSCAIINQRELEMEFREKSKNLNDLIKKLSFKNNIQNLIVTRGSNGAILYDKKNNKFFSFPALANKVTDKIGAGDAFLSLASIFLNIKEKKQFALLMGSLAAAQSTEDIGNKNAISKLNILKSLDHMLK